MHGSHHNHGVQQSAPMSCLVTGHEECCHSMGLRHWSQRVSWVIDLHHMLLSVELPFAGLAGSHVDDSHWMREFGCPKQVRVRDGQCRLGTGPCVYLGYASEAEVLWCNDEMASADMIDRDVTSEELASKANEQRKVAIEGPDRGSKKQGVEIGDANQSSSDASEQQHMESTIDGERRQTMSSVVDDLQEVDRRIDTKSERFGAFSGESLD